jgi:YHS domain-containing protein
MKSILIAVSALLIMGRALAADNATPSPQTVCPVMGGKVNKTLFVDYDGKRVYVCCPGCLPDLKQDPAKYISQLEAKGIKLDIAPKPAPDAKK